MKFAIKPCDINTHLTLGMLLHYFGKLKIKFYADIQQVWKKMQRNWILSAPMNTRLPWYLTDSPVGLRLVLLTQD